ncbi:MAG: homocysteine S-methyltransferase family protein [Oscillospiraceae bacterium]|nr:homocysteine S-methyltransferase family protein [Oscillospiraceae bacterium]
MNLREYTENRLLFFDGAMGTMLQRQGLASGDLPELLCRSSPDAVTKIHMDYVAAGADVVTANTFQANELKLGAHSVEDVVEAAVNCAKASGARFTALDAGPLGQLMEPMGPMTFDRAYEIYARQIKAGAKAGADLILIETISDLYEAKAAVLAAKENTSLPVFCTMTFEENGRTFMGCDPLSAVLTLQGLGVDALGVNCSLGPEKLRPVVDIMLRYSRVPVMLQANAGLPVMRGGIPCYDITPEQYAAEVMGMINRGVAVIGGCCGTDPDYIRLIKKMAGDSPPAKRAAQRVTACSSGSRAVIFDDSFTVIGERLNPTGKSKMQEALRDGDMDYLTEEAIAQADEGAALLDLNVFTAEIDEASVMAQAVREIGGMVKTPLQIDSADPITIEAGCRAYNGKPIINSVNGKKDAMEKIFPIAKKYGALIIGLTLDENGVPPTAQGRFDIARRILEEARHYGIPEEDLIIDCIALPAATHPAQSAVTLEAIRLVKEKLNLKTILGISNVSFGLPGRDKLNAAFLAAALGAGLDSAIMDPAQLRSCAERRRIEE